MIPSNPNPQMSREEVERFHAEMSRRIRGEFTPQERRRYENRKEVYNRIMKQNGGYNPLLGY